MKNCNTSSNRTTPRILPAAFAAVAGSVSLSQAIHADPVSVPPVPSETETPSSILKAHATGTQDYTCLPSGSGFAWTFFGPQATLCNGAGKQVITHFLSPKPFEDDALSRVTWQHSRDTSTVWDAVSQSSADPDFVETNAVFWVLVRIVGAQDGPTGGNKLTPTTFIQRNNTSGGVASSTDRTVMTDVGRKGLVPYTAEYFC